MSEIEKLHSLEQSSMVQVRLPFPAAPFPHLLVISL